MRTEQFKLSNGLPVIYMVNPATPLSYACLSVNAGAKDDKPNELGLAHAVEHFLFMGSKLFSKQEINDFASQRGTSLEGFTDIDFTSFGFRSLPEYFSDMLLLMADVLINPKFPQEEIKDEIEIIKTEMTIKEDEEKYRQIGYNLHSCFGLNREKAKVLGTAENVSRFKADMVRNFWYKYYTAQNSVLCVYTNSDSHKSLLESSFSKMRQGASNPFSSSPFSGKFYKAKGCSSEVDVSLIFSLQKQVCPEDELLANILGGNYSARLYYRLRTKHPLVYAVSADINFYACGDIFYISTTCLQKNLEKVIIGLCEEIVSLRNNEITTEDLECAKKTLKTELLAAWESPENLVFDCAEDYLLGRFIPLREKLRNYEQITIDKVCLSAQKIFGEKPTYGIIGNMANAPSYQKVLEMLKL